MPRTKPQPAIATDVRVSAPRPTHVGINYRHELGFTIDRTRGAGFYFFLRLLTPVIMRCASGMRRIPAGHCVLFTPDFPAWYHGDGIGLGNDWFHASGDLTPLLLRYDLPPNEPFRPQTDRFIRPMLQELQDELLGGQEYREQAALILLERLLLNLGRARNTKPCPRGKNDAQEELFRRLRREMLAAYGQRWRVEELAAHVHLSPSRFAALYRRYFGSSPVEDLLQRRIAQAEIFLSGTNMPVGEVARRCGFENIYYFSRAFRQRTGVPPSQYAKAQTPADERSHDNRHANAAGANINL